MRLRHQPLIGLALLVVASSARGQVSSTFGDTVYRRLLDFKSLVKGGAVVPHWMADGKSFWYVEGTPDRTVFQRVDPAANAVTPIFDLTKLRASLTDVLGHRPPYDGVPFETFDFVDGETAALFNLEGKRYRVELASYRVTPIGAATPAPAPPPPFGPSAEIPAPRGPWTAVLSGSNIALRSKDDGRIVPLTKDSVERFGWSLDRAAWNPTGARLLALKSDERAVHFMPVVHWLKPGHEEITWQAYSSAGEQSERSELWIVDAQSGQQLEVDVGGVADQIIQPLGWRPDGSEVLFVRIDRLYKKVDLMAASAKTGKSSVLLTERQETFVDGLAFNSATMYFPFADGSKFVWRSERDGWSHLYLYDAQGTLIRRLTSGELPVERVDAIDEKNGWIYYTAHGDPGRPYDEQVYRVDLEGKRATRLTNAAGVHVAAFAPGKEFFLDTHSTVDQPPVVEFRKGDGTLVRQVASADISALKAMGWRPPTEFKVKAADGKTDLYGALFTPHDFDPARKYPVVDLQYMGNFIHSAPHTFVGTWLGDDAQSLTQLGFVVFIVDGRGTTGRGKAFQDFTYNSIGKFEVQDHIAALRQLALTRPFMDTTRVGITGYSWGGYYTLRALLTAPGIFKVGVSGAPVVDLLAHRSPIEAYMGLPQDNPDGYEQGSNIRLADKLQGKLLIAIGTSDVNVTFNHSMRMVNALVKAGKFFDLIILPEETHGLTPPALAYYTEPRNRYLAQHLGAAAAAPASAGRAP